VINVSGPFRSQDSTEGPQTLIRADVGHPVWLRPCTDGPAGSGRPDEGSNAGNIGWLSLARRPVPAGLFECQPHECDPHECHPL